LSYTGTKNKNYLKRLKHPCNKENFVLKVDLIKCGRKKFFKKTI